MEVKTLCVLEDNKLGLVMAKWGEEKRIEVIYKPLKSSELLRIIDGVVLFHENHNFSREDEDLIEFLNNGNKAVHKVDINGTLSATNSNFNMWLERNKPRCLLILGDEIIADNPHLPKFLDGIED